MRHKFSSPNADLIGGDDFEYTERSEYWLNYRPKAGRGRPKKFKYREPLILCGHGVSIRVDHNTLLVRNGFTHFPQKASETRFFPGDGNLPDRIVVMDGNGGISFDALAWMADQNIEFVRLDWRGNVSAIGWNVGYSASPQLVQAQKAARSGPCRFEIARWLLIQKIDSCIETLKNIGLAPDIQAKAFSRIGIQRKKLQKAGNCTSMPSIMGTEGQSAAAYFRAWQGLPLHWAGIKKRPIPEDWNRTVARAMVWRDRARTARHPVNAMLNYGYGILTSKIRSQVIAAGLDPTIGIIHGNSGNRIPLIYDLMEPLRPTVDRAVLQFSLSHTFMPGDFTITKWGGCRLNPQLAKRTAELLVVPEVTRLVRNFIKRL